VQRAARGEGDGTVTEPETFEGPRGLRGYVRMNTTYGETVELQESSAVILYSGAMDELEGPFAWLRLEEDGVSVSAHMSVDQMKALRRALKNAIHAWDIQE
jgi:hypothetical protein